MEFLFIILWIIAPIFLIPISIINYLTKSKLKKFVQELFNKNRISLYEYNNLKTESQISYNNENTFNSNVMSAHQKDASVNPQKSIISSESSIPTINNQSKNTPQSHNEPKKEIRSISILFAIGVAFVIIAGFIFSTAIWVYLSNTSRTGIIALTAAFFFAISALARKKFKINNTSDAFFMLGSVFSVISFITAGYFNLFGDWFSINGEGSLMFFSVSALIFSAFSALGIKLIKKSIYIYSMLFSSIASIAFVLAYLSDEKYTTFALFISIFSSLLSIIYILLKKIIPERFCKSVKFTHITTRIIFGTITIPFLFSGIIKWHIFSFLICLLIFAELTAYGIKMNNKLMLSIQSIFAVASLYEIFFKLSIITDDNILPFFLFTMAVIALILIYRSVKSLNTFFSEKIFISTSFISACFLLETSLLPYGILSMLGVEFILILSALDFKILFSKLYRIILPLPIIIIAFEINDYFHFYLKSSYYYYSLIICSIIFIFIAFACGYIIKSDRRFVLIKYSFEFFSGLILAGVSFSFSINALAYVFIMLFSVVLFAEIYSSEKNIHSIIPLFAFFSSISQLIHINSDYYLDAGDTLTFISIIMCAVMICTSRIIFNKSIHIKDENKSHWDTFCVGAFFSIILADTSSNIFSNKARTFIILTELAVFAANLYRKKHSNLFNSITITCSVALFSIALINRPFLNISNDLIASKFTLLIIAAFGYIARKIWHKNQRFSINFSFSVYSLVYGLLLIDALINESLLNTLFVLCTSLVILIYSFMVKKKKWFLISASGLTGLTIYITKDLLLEIDWWIYLLLAGILLISIAATNEYFKNKTNNLKKLAGRFFEDWSW